MAYKYEVEKKTNAVKVRVLIAVYVMFVVSSILIGIAVRLQQLQNIRPVDPKADTAGNPSAAAISMASDPTYDVRQLKALAYCDVVNAEGQPTGDRLPLAARFTFRQIKRDVGQYSIPLANVCTDATGEVCNWKTINDGEVRCRNGQTIAQCNPSNYNSCDDNAIPGALFYYPVTKDSTATNYVVDWPGNESLGNLINDNNEVDVILNTNLYDLAGNTIVRNGITYTINKSSLSTVDTSSLFPIYQWRCNNDVCTGTGNCTNAGITYSDTLCSFNSSTRLFQCPANKYTRYGVLSDNKSYYYNLTSWAGQVGNDPTWVKAGYAYETLADNTYNNAIPGATDNAITFKGNVVKYRFTCQAATVTTPSVSTPTVTPDSEISAIKRGPACVERVAPNNIATFSITVTNTGTTATVINEVEDALPQGFTYNANTTFINGVAVNDSYVTTVNSGTSQKVTFAPPAGQTPWTLNPQQVMTITFSTTATGNAVTGINTNRVVVVPEGDDAIDNITWQFEVAQTCNPETGIFDEPMIVFGLSGVLVVFGLYLLYAPSGDKFLQKFGNVGQGLRKKVAVSIDEKTIQTNKKKQFEKGLLKKMKRK
jgi:uncharacterized repeat protein (TIGR01451 family)